MQILLSVLQMEQKHLTATPLASVDRLLPDVFSNLGITCAELAQMYFVLGVSSTWA